MYAHQGLVQISPPSLDSLTPNSHGQFSPRAMLLAILRVWLHKLTTKSAKIPCLLWGWSYHLCGLEQLSRCNDSLRYGGLGIESRWGEILRAHSDRPRGQPSVLYSGYRVILRVRGWDVALTTHPIERRS